MLDLLVENARLTDLAFPVSIGIDDGHIVDVWGSKWEGPARRRIDARGGLVTPSLVEAHYHPDKANTRPRLTPAMGAGGWESAKAVKAGFTVDDVEARASEALRTAVSHGVGCMRAEVDVDSLAGLTCFEGVRRASEHLASVIDVQLVAFPQEGLVCDPGAVDLLREALSRGAHAVGAWPNAEQTEEAQVAHIEAVFDLAEEFDVPVDVHIAALPATADDKVLGLLAERATARRFEGRVTASHCTALERYSDEEATEVITRVATAGISICICPIDLQDDDHFRGVSRPRELLAAGVNVYAGSDNCNDAWYRFGRLDPIDTAYMACLAMGQDTPEAISAAFEMVTSRAAQALGLDAPSIGPDQPADLVIFDAGSLVDVMRGLPGSRTVIKHGRVVGGSTRHAWISAGPRPGHETGSEGKGPSLSENPRSQ